MKLQEPADGIQAYYTTFYSSKEPNSELDLVPESTGIHTYVKNKDHMLTEKEHN